MLTDEDLDELRDCESPDEWNDTCDKIKEKNGGKYPADWFQKVIVAGIIEKTAAKWGGTGKINIESK